MNLAEGHDLGSVLNITPKQVSTGLALFYVCYVIFDLNNNPAFSDCYWVSSLQACGPVCRIT